MDLKGEITRQRPGRLLTAEQFQQLAEIPAELEWLANIQNEHTRKDYKHDVRSFMRPDYFESFGRLEPYSHDSHWIAIG